MSTSRHLPLLACLPLLTLSCAIRPELAPSQRVVSAEPHWTLAPESAVNEQRSSRPRPTNAYAPTRAPNPGSYFWRTEKPAECAPEASEPDNERPLEPSAARALLAAIPERAFSSPSDVHPVSPELVVASLRPALHLCFSHWLADELDAEGSARFALELDCAGQVEAISAENQGVDESTLACLFSAMGPARFAPPPAGHATVLVPVMFKNAH